jgi:hypothetical protein
VVVQAFPRAVCGRGGGPARAPAWSNTVPGGIRAAAPRGRRRRNSPGCRSRNSLMGSAHALDPPTPEGTARRDPPPRGPHRGGAAARPRQIRRHQRGHRRVRPRRGRRHVLYITGLQALAGPPPPLTAPPTFRPGCPGHRRERKRGERSGVREGGIDAG